MQENGTNRRPFEIIARVIRGIMKGIAILLGIGVLLILFYCWFGNPITFFKAGQQMNQHIAQHYADLDVKVSRTKFDFLYGKYYKSVSSKSQEDIEFGVSYDIRSGKISDTYAERVVQGRNVLARYLQEYREELTPLLKEEFGESFDGAGVSAGGFSGPTPKAGEAFDPSKLAGPTLNVYLKADELTSGVMSRYLKDIHAFVKQKGYAFDRYQVRIYQTAGKDWMEVNFITPRIIEEEDLEKLIDRGLQDGEALFEETGVSVLRTENGEAKAE